MRGEAEINIIEYSCVTYNDREITESIKNEALKIFSKDAVWNKYYKPSLAGEDFSYYTKEIKGCFALISKNPHLHTANQIHDCHNSVALLIFCD